MRYASTEAQSLGRCDQGLKRKTTGWGRNFITINEVYATGLVFYLETFHTLWERKNDGIPYYI
ncbi:hypothetical protein BDZ94DRAFT_1244049 [Collybia nuda]|uniref:Uncharacterized protein n=1 Tax=Collybia nuda TaxID=64659 RepID=A0A9P5YIE5_9AGAR|nr:hypothetical protein BDZ94DRAFT_1244049 [Collybia nuda]